MTTNGTRQWRRGDSTATGAKAFAQPILGWKQAIELRQRGRLRYAEVALAVVGMTVAMLPVRNALGVLNVLLLYLLLTFALALVIGSGAAALAAAMSFFAFDFFFIPPFHTFAVARREDTFALVVFLVVAVATGQLTARVGARNEVAERERRRTELLYELNAALIGDVTLDAILGRIVERVVHVYGAAQCRILLPEGSDQLTVRASFPAAVAVEAHIDRELFVLASWAMEHRTPTGRRSAARSRIRRPHVNGKASPSFPSQRRSDVLCLPIATAERVVGVLEVGAESGSGSFDEEDANLLGSFANQAALALERARLTEEAARAAMFAESDALKSALLSTVSHDLRTPLAAIKASATSLLDTSVMWSDEARGEFLHAIDEEADRLALMVENLLDMSRIEGGALRPDKEWYDAAELIADVADRLAPLATRHRLSTDVPLDLPLACFDYVEIAQVIMNLGENAIKYTPEGTQITIAARQVAKAIEITVADDGPGIQSSKQIRLFDKFYRIADDGRVPGSGIGLAICKGLVEAHGGRIWVESRKGDGATFRLTVPLGEQMDIGGCST